MYVWAAGMPEKAAAATWAYLDPDLGWPSSALFCSPHLLSPYKAICSARLKYTQARMLHEMDASLAASSRPSTSYSTGLPKPVPSHRHRLAPEQLRSASNTVGVLIYLFRYIMIGMGVVGG